MTDWLLGTLVATSGLTLIVLLAREPVRRRFGSRVTYGLWLIPAARLLMPTLTRTVERTVPPEALPTTVPLPDPSLLASAGGWPTVLLAIWVAVAAGLFVSRMNAFHRDRRAILATSVEIARYGSIRLVRSPEVVSPIAFGILNRVIAIPHDFECSYDARERRFALDHELAHHRSGDLVANLFAFVLLCLQWFNPLAWVAHAVFRFDQEAACDARVLDKATARDRADYGRAIAKAASGRALLFASALDRPKSLHRRLHSMLFNPNPAPRLAGRLLIAAAIAVALPLTASRAVDYVDVLPPVPPKAVPAVAARPVAVAAVQPIAPARALPAVRPVASVAAVQATAASPDADSNLTISGDRIIIDGQVKRWEDLTPAEKARVRAAVAKAQSTLASTHLDQARIMRDLANVPDRKRMEELQREVAGAQAGAAEALRGVDVQAMQRALAAVDKAKIAGSLAQAQDAMARAKAELARVQARIDAGSK